MIRPLATTLLAALALAGCGTATIQTEHLSRSTGEVGEATAAPLFGAARTNHLPPPPAVSGQAYIVVNPRTGEILLSKNERQRRPVASTQKLMTCLVLLDGGKLDQSATVVASDTYAEPTVMGIRPGETYNRRRLLEAMVVRSSNDIAKCLARTEAGSEAAFAQLMNRKAQQLGMRDTHFVNASGLTAPGQYSTAFDLAILATHAMNHNYLHRLTQTRELTFVFPDGRTKQVTNTNKVLRMSPYCTGMKTGFTDPAGRCLVSTGRRGMQEVIVVMLGSQIPDIWNDSYALLHWALGIGEEET